MTHRTKGQAHDELEKLKLCEQSEEFKLYTEAIRKNIAIKIHSLLCEDNIPSEEVLTLVIEARALFNVLRMHPRRKFEVMDEIKALELLDTKMREELRRRNENES